jgi:two-component system, OmpR family, sensor histidine kinase KdpD
MSTLGMDAGISRKRAGATFPRPVSGHDWSRGSGRLNQPVAIDAAALIVFGVAASGATAAQQAGWPVTAAIIFLFGVTLVGGLKGLRGGLLAAIVASVTYNFFLTDPAFQFTFSSAEDYVPLIAFNASAAASGILAGRLKDRALAAELSSQRMRALFDVSRSLQAAVHLRDIPPAISDFRDDMSSAPEIYVRAEDGLAPIQQATEHIELARSLFASGAESQQNGEHKAFLLTTPEGPEGVLVLSWMTSRRPQSHEHDLEAFLNLLSITLERCLLLERLSEVEFIKRSEKFKTALLSSVSHDLRTPLSAIAASASSLSRFGSELSPETRADFLSMIQEQCEKLDRYTTNLLNLSRLQAGVDRSHFIQCDALEVLGTAISTIRSGAAKQEIAKQFEATAAVVCADPVMLEQVFYNVLENATHYSPEGSLVTVRTANVGSSIMIEVADEGEGIPTPDLERVFERFYRSRSAQSQSGSGLGLSIARGFTEAFGGRITAMRADPSRHGTIIRIELPLTPTSEVQA